MQGQENQTMASTPSPDFHCLFDVELHFLPTLIPHREERAVCAWAAQGTISQTGKRYGSVIAVSGYYLMFYKNTSLDQNGSPWKVTFLHLFIC